MKTLPYPGLRSFDLDEMEYFFGRHIQIAQLLDKIKKSRFLAVVGPSGCGKSSLVKTGLLNAMQAETETVWLPPVILRPGLFLQTDSILKESESPRRNLAKALLEQTASLLPKENESKKEFLLADLHRGPLGLVQFLQKIHLSKNKNLLVLVDQFEEIFRYRKYHDRDEAEAFVDLLLESANQSEIPIYVIITMRSDFLGDCVLFDGLPEALNKGMYLTPRLIDGQRSEAIICPARVAGGSVDPKLEVRLLNDMEALDKPNLEQDQLPLLQHALMRLWISASDREERPITLRPIDYEAIGGLKQGLSEHANEVFEKELKEQQPYIAEKLFVCLIEQRSEKQHDIRRPTQLQEIAEIAGVSWQAVADVVKIFRKPECSFLMPSEKEFPELKSDTIIDISHESLIRQWDKLKYWAEDEAKSVDLFINLVESAHKWKKHKRQGDLWGRMSLKDYKDRYKDSQPNKAWAKRLGYNEDDLKLAIEYLEASEKEEANRRRLIEGLAIASSRYLADKVLNLLEHLPQSPLEPQLELLLALEALSALKVVQEKGATKISNPTAEKALRQALALRGGYCLYGGSRQEQQQISTLAISPDNRWLFTAGQDKIIRQWNLDDSKTNIIKQPILLFGHQNWITNLAISPDGCWLASGGNEIKILLWDLQKIVNEINQGQKVFNNPQILYERTQGQDREVRALVMGPLGENVKDYYLAVGSEDSTIYLWKFTNGEKSNTYFLSTQSRGVKALAISPLGHWLASGHNSGDVLLWDLRSINSDSIPHHAYYPLHDKVTARAVGFGGLDEWLVTGSIDSTAYLWRLNNKGLFESPFSLSGHKEAITVVAFSSSSRKNLTTDSQNSTTLDSASCINKNQIYKWLATGSEDCTTRIWDLENLREQSPAGQRFPEPAFDLHEHNSWISALAFTDNRWLVTASGDCIARRWDLENREAVPLVFRGHQGQIRAAAISSDNRWLVTCGDDGTARRWDLAGLKDTYPIVLCGHRRGEAVKTVAVSPQGDWLVTGSDDGTVHLWGLTETGVTEKPPLVLNPLAYGVNKAFFIVKYNEGIPNDKQDKWLITAHDDGTIRLWDPENLAKQAAQLRQFYPTPAFVLCGADKPILWENAIRAIAVSTDGLWLVAGSNDKNAYLWNLSALDGRPAPIGCDLRLMSVDTADGLVNEGSNLVIVALVGTNLHIRIFDANGNRIVDKAENQLMSGEKLTTLKKQLKPLPNESGLSPEQKQEIVRDATSIAGYIPPIKADRILKHHQLPVTAVTISQGGWLATGGEDGMCYLWKLAAEGASGEPISLDPLINGIRTMIIVNTEDKTTNAKKDKWLIIGSDQGTVCLWELDTLKSKNPPDFTLTSHNQELWNSAILAMDVSPDGRWLVTGSRDTTALLWDLTPLNRNVEPYLVKDLGSHKRAIRTVTISSKSNWLVTGEDETACLWNLNTILNPGMESEPIDLEGHKGAIQTAVISPDEHWLVTGSDDSTVRVWNLRLDELKEMAHRLIGRNLTLDEWNLYFEQQEYHKTCEHLPVPDTEIVKNKRKDAETSIQGHMYETARLSYKQALDWALEIDDALLYSTIGRSGSIYGGLYNLKDIVELVLPACERAVDLNPKSLTYHDTRALARAFIGDYEGAAEDLSMLKNDPAYSGPAENSGQLKKRQNWIDLLKQNKNPFDDKVILKNFIEQIDRDEYLTEF